MKNRVCWITALVFIGASQTGRLSAQLPPVTPTPGYEFEPRVFVSYDGYDYGASSTRGVWSDAANIVATGYDRIFIWEAGTYNQVTDIYEGSGHATRGLWAVRGDDDRLLVSEYIDDKVRVYNRPDWTLFTVLSHDGPAGFADNSVYWIVGANTAYAYRKSDFSQANSFGVKARDVFANEYYYLLGDLDAKAWKVYRAADFSLATTLPSPGGANQSYGGGMVGDDYFVATWSVDTAIYVYSQADFLLQTSFNTPRDGTVLSSASYDDRLVLAYSQGANGFQVWDTVSWTLLTSLAGLALEPWEDIHYDPAGFVLWRSDDFRLYSLDTIEPVKGVGGVFLDETEMVDLFWHCNFNEHTVLWCTDGTSWNFNSTVSDSGMNHSFQMPVTYGGERYYYQIYTDGKLLCEDSIEPTDTSFNKFTAGMFADDQGTSAQWSATTQLFGNFSPSIYLELGDWVEHGNSFYEWCNWYNWRKPWTRKVPCIPILGNHDNTSPGEQWDNFVPVSMTSCYFSVDVGPVHFAVIDAENECQIDVGTAQWNWLSEDLNSTDKYWKIVCSHQGPYTGILANGIQESVCATDVVPLIKDAGVQAWIYGHNHVAQHIHVDGIDYIHVPAGCDCYSYSLQTDWEAVTFFSDTKGYGMFVCESDNLEFSFYDHSGSVTYGPIQIESPTPTPTATPSLTPTPSVTPTPTVPPPVTPTPSVPPSPASTATPSPSWTTTPSPSPTATGSPSSTPTIPPTPGYLVLQSGDYDGDGTSDIAVFRQDVGLWAVKGRERLYFGVGGDVPVSGDYDGDGSADVSVFRAATGLWAVRDVTRFYFGDNEDLPAPADYDGDGCCDAAVFDEAVGRWSLRGITAVYFGCGGDLPVPGDYEGMDYDEIAIFRPSTGLWAVRGYTRVYYGAAGDKPLPGSYQWYGAGRMAGMSNDHLAVSNYQWAAESPGSEKYGPFASRIAIFRPSSGLWAIRGLTRFYYGISTDTPLAGDMDGDALDDAMIFRPSSGLWAIRCISRVYYGTRGDIPVTR